MDLVSRFSVVQIVNSANLEDAVVAFEAAWVSQFWYPESIHADKAFHAGNVKAHVDYGNIPMRPVPPGRHSKNSIESKPNVIRSMYIRLKESAGDGHDASVASYKVVSISNDLYSNENLSAFELAKGFTKPIINSPKSNFVPQSLLKAHEEPKARRKLALILKSNATQEVPLNIGDLVDVYSKKQHEKRGNWWAPQPVLWIEHVARSVTIAGRNQHLRTVTIENLRPATPRQDLAQGVQEGIDQLDELLDDLTRSNVSPNAEQVPSTKENSDNPDNFYDIDFSNEEPSLMPTVGHKISVQWPMDDQLYDGCVASAQENGNLKIEYNDGDQECLDMTQEKWKFIESLIASAGTISTESQVQSTEQKVLSSMISYFGNKSFLKQQAQGFEQCPLFNSYKEEENSFLKTVKVIPSSQLPSAANIINSHKIYRVKQNDDESLKLKARIAPHGNEDDLNDFLDKDCATCSPTRIQIVQSVVPLQDWTLYKAEFKSAPLRTGKAHRDLYVRPPRESQMKSSHAWFLLTAAYRLVNSNAEWQNVSDNAMFALGITCR